MARFVSFVVLVARSGTSRTAPTDARTVDMYAWFRQAVWMELADVDLMRASAIADIR